MFGGWLSNLTSICPFRQFRIMEGDKEAYSDEAQKVLR